MHWYFVTFRYYIGYLFAPAHNKVAAGIAAHAGYYFKGIIYLFSPLWAAPLSAFRQYKHTTRTQGNNKFLVKEC